MELKIICLCGQKYKFDVQPVNGRMPFTVNCPICQRDGTAAANDLLSHNLTASPLVMQASPSVVPSAPPPPPPPPGMVAPSGFRPPPLPHQAAAAPLPVGFSPPPPPPAAQTAPPPPPIAPTAGGLSIHRASAPGTTAPPPLAAPGSVATPPTCITSRPSVQKQQQMKAKESGQFSMGLGIAGGVGGSLIGGGLMYAFWIWAHFRFPLMGVAVGAFAGYGGAVAGTGHGHDAGNHHRGGRRGNCYGSVFSHVW